MLRCQETSRLDMFSEIWELTGMEKRRARVVADKFGRV